MKTMLLTVFLGFTLGTTGAKSEEPAKGHDYPLTTCVVSDEKLGEMGDPFVFQHEGTEVRLCCKKCLDKFNKDPEKYMKKIEEAAAKEKKPEEKEKP